MIDLYVWTRVHTGRCFVRAHLRERGSNVIVWSCPHEHWSRIATGGYNGTYYATRCAERELRRRVKQLKREGGE